MKKIVTFAQTPSSATRAYSFPVLETGNLSFPDGQYSVEFQPGDDRASFILRHHIKNAPLIARLLEEEKAQYICAVSSPISSYREIHRSNSSEQLVCWNIDDLGEPPYLTLMIVVVAPCNLHLNGEKDGVHEIWHDRRIRLEVGNRIALGPVVQLRPSSTLHLLSFHADEKLEKGSFRVEPETEEGFRFLVKLHPKLHRFLRSKDEAGLRDSIMTHIVTSCFALLQRDFNRDNEDDGGWKSYQNLRILSDLLEDNGLPCWDDENFRPEQAATSLHPHVFPETPDGENT